MSVAVVLGSGGVKCLAALGLWRVLVREGIKVDLVVGCSGGAVFASTFALGFDTDTVLSDASALWGKLFTRPRYTSLVRALFPRLLGFDERAALLDDRHLGAVFDDYFGTRTFADARVPLRIAATDFATGDKVVLEHGRVADAVRASVAIPVLLPPWPVDGRLLVDGGASNPLPIDVAIREGCELIIAMGFENTIPEGVHSMPRLLLRTSTIVQNHLLRSTFAFYSAAHHAEVIPMIPQFDRRIGLNEVGAIPYIVECGERAAEEQLPYLKRLIAAMTR